MSTRSDQANRWRRILHQQRASGLSVAAFCRQTGVPQGSFYAWRKRLRDEGGFAEVLLPGWARAKVGREVAADGREPANGIELRLPGRRSIAVRPGFDRPTLLELLHALEESVSGSALQDADR